MEKAYAQCPACGSNQTELDGEVELRQVDGVPVLMLELWGCECCPARWYERLAHIGYELLTGDLH